MGRDRAQHGGGRLRFGVAIVASAIVHAALLAALWMEPARRPDPQVSAQEPIELVFFESSPAPGEGAVDALLPAGTATTHEGPATVARRHDPPAREAAAAGSRRDEPGEGPDEDPGERVSRSSPTGPAATHRTAPSVMASPDPTGAVLPEGSLTVTPTETPPSIEDGLRLPRELDLRAPIAPPVGAATPEEPIPEGRRLERRLGELFAEDRAVETARLRRDSYWLGLRNRMEQGFSPPMEVVEAGPGADAPGWKGLGGSYLAEASAYGATGTPYGDGYLDPGARRGFAQEMVDSIGERTFGKPPAEPIGETSLFSRRVVAVVELEQAGDGSLAGARLVSSSGVPAYDRLALARVGDPEVVSAASLGPPPPQGRRTKWAFASSLRIIPPAPIVGCAFDAYFIPVECFYPMKKILRHRVSLLAVYDDRSP